MPILENVFQETGIFHETVFNRFWIVIKFRVTHNEFTDLSILEPVFQEDGILPFLNGLVFALHRGLKIQISP